MHIPVSQASVIDELPILANDYYTRIVPTASGDSHANGLGTADLCTNYAYEDLHWGIDIDGMAVM